MWVGGWTGCSRMIKSDAKPATQNRLLITVLFHDKGNSSLNVAVSKNIIMQNGVLELEGV